MLHLRLSARRCRRVESLLTGSLPGVPIVFLHHTALSGGGRRSLREADAQSSQRVSSARPMSWSTKGRSPTSARPWRSADTGRRWARGDPDHPGDMRQVPSASLAPAPGPGRGGGHRHRHLRHVGRHPGGLWQPHGVHERAWTIWGADYRSALGVPVVNVPGCSPIGDNFTETVAAVLLFLQGLGPLPGVRRAGPPGLAVRRDGPPQLHPRRLLRGGHVRRALRRQGVPGRDRLLGTGRQLQHHLARGDQSHRWLHECRRHRASAAPCRASRTGSPRFTKRRRATFVSGTASKLVGSFVRPLRRITQRYGNREVAWDRTGAVSAAVGVRRRVQPSSIDWFTSPTTACAAAIPTPGTSEPGRSRSDAN